MSAPHEYSRERIERDLATCEVAYEGPWAEPHYEAEPAGRYVVTTSDPWRLIARTYAPGNAAFIAASREGWPDALHALRARDAEIERLRKELSAAENELYFARENLKVSYDQVNQLNATIGALKRGQQ